MARTSLWRLAWLLVLCCSPARGAPGNSSNSLALAEAEARRVIDDRLDDHAWEALALFVVSAGEVSDGIRFSRERGELAFERQLLEHVATRPGCDGKSRRQALRQLIDLEPLHSDSPRHLLALGASLGRIGRRVDQFEVMIDLVEGYGPGSDWWLAHPERAPGDWASVGEALRALESRWRALAARSALRPADAYVIRGLTHQVARLRAEHEAQ